MNLGFIKVTYEAISDAIRAEEVLQELSKHDAIACDFETAIKFSPEDLTKLRQIVEDKDTDYVERKQAIAALSATPLDHPAYSVITHCSMAVNDHEGFTFNLDNDDIIRVVLGFLVTSDVKQIWFNASYDFLHLYFHTGKMPKNYEDAQIYVKTVFNHVEPQKAKASLKELAGSSYGPWGLSSDYFNLSNRYDPTLLLYAATDACATMWVWERILEGVNDAGVHDMSTADHYSPWDLLPAENPKTVQSTDSEFYHKVAKHFVRDTVRLMSNGVPICLDEVRNLEETLIDILNDVGNSIASNPLVISFLDSYNQELYDVYKQERKSRYRSPSYYYSKFDSSKPKHRNYYMYVFSQKLGIPFPATKEGESIPHWSAALVKRLSTSYPPLTALVNHTIADNDIYAEEASRLAAEDSARRHNKGVDDKSYQSYEEFLEKSPTALHELNLNSSKQLQAFFSWCGEESEEQSAKTGADSWDREQIERVNKTTSDDNLVAVTSNMIEHSFAAIVKNNFIKAFYRFTLDGVLHGNYNLLGAKTARFTSNKPFCQGLYKRNFISKSA
jgi:hypothetical protein